MSQLSADQPAFAVDHALAQQAVQGGGPARELLARRLSCVPAMLRCLFQRAGWRVSSHDLEDLAQDVLATVWRRLPDFDGRCPLEVWVSGFCRNRSLKWRERGQGRFPALGGEEDPLQALQGPESVEPGQALDDERLRAALGGLPRPMAEVVHLKHFEDLTFEQIGERLNCSANTIKTRYYRALGLLSQALQSLAPEGYES